jgi:hypothetical protein
MLLKILAGLSCILSLVLFGEASIRAARITAAALQEEPSPKFIAPHSASISADCGAAVMSPAALEESR